MRFVPHRSVELQFTLDKIDSDYDSVSENDASSQTTVEKADDGPEQLSELLEKLGLNERYQLVSKLSEAANWSGNEEDEEDEDEQGDTLLAVSEPSSFEVKPVAGRGYHDEVGSIKSRIEERRKRVASAVDTLIKEEEVRKRREEEERQRAEAERKRKEEEARALAAAEAQRKKEAEEKRLREEEEQRKREAEEKKRLAAEALKKKEEEAKRLAAEEASRKKAAAEKCNATDFVAVEKEFLKYKQDIADIKTQVVEPVKANKELKRQVGAQKRKINPKFGQLTNSKIQLKEITIQMRDLIAQTQGNELAYKWILNFVAKAIVSQAEAEVAVKPASALALGSLAVDLLLLFPELSYYLMARFVKKCPLVIGYTCTIDTEEGRLRMGWRRSGEDGKWETEGRYIERLCGIATLFSVMSRLRIMPSYQGYTSNAKHPLPISRSWTMLARAANTPLKLVSNVHFSVIGAWWDSCAAQFQQAYGSQGKKLMQLLWNNWTASVADRRFSGAARLRLLGDDWTQGKLEKLPDMEA